MHILLFYLMFLMLAACGGGNGNSKESFSVEEARTLTGSSPPIETNADRSARIAEIISRQDTLMLSSVHLSFSDRDLQDFTIRATCSEGECILHEPQIGLESRITVDDFSINSRDANVSVNHSKHGITLSGGKTDDGDLKALGTWMQHSLFQVSEERSTTSDGTNFRLRYGISSGDLTGNAPVSSAKWYGLMVGTPAAGTNRGNFLQGDARLTYNFSGTVDADFTNIKNLDRNRDHSIERISFRNIPVYTDGTFQAGLTGNHIQGGFYGSDHDETTGVFEQSGVVGAFGGLRE